jgi:LacI family transcriptional regulator
MATIYDVARKARVSTYTVSSVLNQSARVSPELTKRVLKAVRDLDYTMNALARSLPMRQTRTVGMLIPDIANPFYAKVVRGVEDKLREAGYSLLLGNTYNRVDEQSRYVALFRSRQVDALLLFVCAGDDPELRSFLSKGKPVVFVGRKPIGLEADSVSADNRRGTEMAVAHLLGKGHRRVALLNGQRGLSSTKDRTDGWRRALRAAKLGAPAALHAWGDWTADGGYLAAWRFLQQAEPPTAVFAANFLMMTGVLKLLQEQGLACPRDVEVMSSDDSEWLDVFQPPVSTVVQPSYDMGAEAARLFLERLHTPKKKLEHIVLQPELRIR